jgi:hypothetical protein
MKILAIYDNQGKTIDRYTVVFDEKRLVDLPVMPKFHNKYLYMCLNLSVDPTHYMGVSQFSEGLLGRHLGKKIQFNDLSADLQKHIEMRMNSN